jgi:hypothetical protein
MNRDDAIELASAFMTKDGYQHGKCLSAEIAPRHESETWEVEFAYEGMEERSPTTDPPSIVIAVESESREARLATLM